jgi:hypothetical protein
MALPSGAFGQETHLGNEFQVNSHTSNAQFMVSVAAEADGDFVAAWISIDQDGSGHGIFARRFSRAGIPLASEFQVNTHTMGYQTEPAAALDADGDFVVAWQSAGQDGSEYGIFARRFSSAGLPLATEFQVNLYTQDTQTSPAVAARADGDFVVAWQSSLQDGGQSGIFARRFSSTGAPLATEFQVNAYTTGDQTLPSTAMDADFVVVWQSDLQDGSSDGVFARRFSSAGDALAVELQVNTHTLGSQRNASVAAGAGGDFVVAWQSDDQDGSPDGSGIFARRFSSAGDALASEFQVNTFTPSQQRYPSVAARAGGGFVVAWQSADQDGDDYGIFGRRFSSAGAPLAVEFQAATHTADLQNEPVVASSAGAAFVVAWRSEDQDGSYGGVFAQRFGGAIALDVDGNGQVQALTDGLLVLRRFFGLSGGALTGGAVGAGCTRCDAAAIEPYIAGLGLALDVDGNGATQALADGLLAVRYLFGLRDAALTGGAVGAGCARCDAAAIKPYLAGLAG